MENSIASKSLRKKFIDYTLCQIKNSMVGMIVIFVTLLAINPGIDILGHLLGAYEESGSPLVELKTTVFEDISKMTFYGVSIGALFGVFRVNYLHNKRKLDFYLSIPLSRNAFLFSNIITAFVMVIGPYVIQSFVSAVYFYDVPDVWMTSLIMGLKLMIIIVANYALGAFICVCCGRTMDAIIVYALYNFSFATIYVLIVEMAAMIVPGVSNIQPKIEEWYAWGMPMALCECDSELPFIWWAVVSVVLFITTAKLMKKRKTEVAQDKFAYRATEYIVEFFAELLFAMGAGTITSQMCVSNGDVYIEIIWYVIGALFGGFVSHTILHFLFTRSSKGYISGMRRIVLSVATACGIMGVIITGIFGYDDYIPEIGEIKSANISSSHAREFWYKGKNILEDGQFSEEELKELLNLHTSIVEYNKEFKKNGMYSLQGTYDYDSIDYEENINTYTSSITIYYTLKNGDKIKREYDLYKYKDVTMSIKLRNRIEDESSFLRYETIHSAGVPYEYITNINIDKYDEKCDLDFSYWMELAECGRNKAFFEELFETYIDEEENKNGNRRYSLNLYYSDDEYNNIIVNLDVYDSHVNTLKLLEESKFNNRRYALVSDEYFALNASVSKIKRTDECVYVEVPEGWYAEEPVYGMPVIGYDEYLELYDEQGYALFDMYSYMDVDKHLECEKVTIDGKTLYKYMLPKDKSMNGVIFYQRTQHDFRCSYALSVKDSDVDGKIATRISGEEKLQDNNRGEKFEWK